MPFEGHLGKYALQGERAALDGHPPVILPLVLTEGAKAAAIPIGTVLKRAEGEDAAYETLLASDGPEARPVAVVDDNYDPDIDKSGSALCLLHGCVKMRLLKTGDGQELNNVQVAQLFETGIYPL